MTKLIWKWEDEEDDGEGVGPVWIEGPGDAEEKWDEWVRRSIAEKHAKDHGFEFFADE